jgi:HSP20 family protein
MTLQIVATAPVAGYVAPVSERAGTPRQRKVTALHPGTGGAIIHLEPRPDWSPSVNVFDTGDAFVVIAELAGVGPDGLRIELDERADTVTLRGTRRDAAPCPADAFDAVDAVDEEIASGRFERVIAFDDPLDARGARAVCRYGLLELLLPKRRPRWPRRAACQ